jgi:hypothetical protein
MRNRLAVVATVLLVVLGALAAAGGPAGSRRPGRERTVIAYLTGYSYWDNTPPGSAGISHPVVHEEAGGTGTYADPVTVAVGHTITGDRDVLDWPAGTRFYVPSLRRYLVVEDTCGDGPRPQDGPCHAAYPSGASTWLDVWVGGADAPRSWSDACMRAITQVTRVLVDPAPGHRVSAGPLTGGACRNPRA